MAKFVKIDESELPCPMWLYGNVDDLDRQNGGTKNGEVRQD
nr:MAG TPA: hypothetical protein [Caudoviricetes sp.]